MTGETNNGAFMYAPFGYVCCEVVFNEMNQPENYSFLNVNPAFEKMTGQEREMILGKKAAEVMPGIGIDNVDWVNFCRGVALNNEKKEIIKYLEPLGIWCRIIGFPIQHNRIAAVFWNVSEDIKYIRTLKGRHRTTRQLSRDFEIFLKGAQEAMFLVKVRDGEFRYVLNNSEHSRLTGFSREMIRGKTPVELVGEELGRIIEANYRRCAEEERTVSYEETLLLPAGLKTWFTSLTPVWDREKIQYIVGSSKDITLQRITEEKLRKNFKNEELVSNISRLALQERDTEVFMEKLVTVLGEGMGVSRVCLFERNIAKETVSNTYEWTAPGISSRKNTLQGMSESDFLWWFDTLRTKGLINYSDTKLIPDKKPRETLKILGVKSLLVLPLYIEGELYGLIGLDECLRNREWEEEEVMLLVIVKEIIEIYLLQKKREDMLWFENQRFKALVNSTEDIIYELDEEKKVIGIYGSWLNSTDFKPMQFLGKKICEIFSPERAGVHEKAHEKALKGKHTVYEWSIDIRDEVKHFQTSLSPITGRKDAITGVVGIGREITMLINAREELQKERELLRTTLLSIGDAVVTTDREGRIKTMNKAAEDITKWSMKEAKDKMFSEVFKLVNENTRQKAEDPIARVLRTGEIIELANHTVLINRHGQRIPIADSAAPIKSDDGKIYGVVMVFRDVTREKEQQRQILYLSYHDVLTGIYNRRFMEEKIKQVDISREVPYTVIMGDVNGLKLVNDIFGHEMGDRLLQKAVETIKGNCRKEDVVGRWGGDEFLILMPNANAETGESTIKKIKQNCERDKDTVIKLSISLGYAVKENAKESLRQTIKEAEEWLYRRKLLEGKSYRNGIINALLTILFAKSIETEEHAERLQKYCVQIGEKLKLSAKELDDLSLLAVLHDIGKVGVNESIMMKAGLLAPNEWKEMKKHPEIGYRIARNTPELAGIAEYIFHHHERWDGKGYPLGLKEEQTPLPCRILAVADAYDAMITDRSYRKARSKEEAIAEIKRNSGTQFDPYIVDQFVEIIELGD